MGTPGAWDCGNSSRLLFLAASAEPAPIVAANAAIPTAVTTALQYFKARLDCMGETLDPRDQNDVSGELFSTGGDFTAAATIPDHTFPHQGKSQRSTIGNIRGLTI